MTAVAPTPLDLHSVKLPRNKWPFEFYQALQYLGSATNNAAVQWLTANQLLDLLASKPAASSPVPGLHDAPPGDLPQYVAVRVLDRRMFLQAIAQVESERKWGQKQRIEAPEGGYSMGIGPPVTITEDEMLMLADKFRSQASRHGFIMGHTFGLNVVSLTSKTWRRSQQPAAAVYHYENWTRAPGQFDPFTIVLIGDADVKRFQPGATIDDIGKIRPKSTNKGKSASSRSKPDQDGASSASGGTRVPSSQARPQAVQPHGPHGTAHAHAHGGMNPRFVHSFHSLDNSSARHMMASRSGSDDRPRGGIAPFPEASIGSLSSSSSHGTSTRMAPQGMAIQARSTSSLPQLSANGSVMSPRLPQQQQHALRQQHQHPSPPTAQYHPPNHGQYAQQPAIGQYGVPPLQVHADTGYYSPMVYTEQPPPHASHPPPHGWSSGQPRPHESQRYNSGGTPGFSSARSSGAAGGEWAHLAPSGLSGQQYERDRSFSSFESGGYLGGAPPTMGPPSHRPSSSSFADMHSGGHTSSSGSQLGSMWSSRTDEGSPSHFHSRSQPRQGGGGGARGPPGAFSHSAKGIRGGISPSKGGLHSPLHLAEDTARVGIAMAPPRHSPGQPQQASQHAKAPAMNPAGNAPAALPKYAPRRRMSLEVAGTGGLLQVNTAPPQSDPPRQPPVRHQSMGSMIAQVPHAGGGAPAGSATPPASSGARGIPLHPTHTRNRLHSAASSSSWGGLAGNGNVASPAMRTNSNDGPLESLQGGVSLTKVGSFRSVNSCDRGSESGADTPSSRKRGRSSSDIIDAPPSEFMEGGHLAASQFSAGSVEDRASCVASVEESYARSAPGYLPGGSEHVLPLGHPRSGLYVRLHEGENGELSVAHVLFRDDRGVESTVPAPEMTPEDEVANAVEAIAAPGTHAEFGDASRGSSAATAFQHKQLNGTRCAARGVAEASFFRQGGNLNSQGVVL